MPVFASSFKPDNRLQPDNWGRELSGMAESNKLSDKAIKSAGDAGKPAIINDGGGLTLICRPDGGDWWRLRY